MLLCLIFSLLTATGQDDPGGLTVMAKVRPGSVFVGQPLELLLGVVGDRERPKVTLPVVEGAKVTLIGTEIRPISASAIGEQVFGQNLYRFRYRLVPRHAGLLTIPPCHAILGERSGVSPPLKVQARAVPSAGRTSDFLGGVGSFDLDAIAAPTSVRRGQAFEYRITVSGPAAIGITTAPVLSRLEKLPLGLRLERRPDVIVAEPPSHTFVYSIRPSSAGVATIPPVPISAFDPETERYVTRIARGVPIRVTDVESFDISRVEYPEAEMSQGRNQGSRLVPIVLAISVGILGLLAFAVFAIRRRRDRSSMTRRHIRLWSERVRNSTDDRDVAQATQNGLVAFLSDAIDRQGGVLTPSEAEEEVANATGSTELGIRAGALVERCDAMIYGGRPNLDGVDLREESLSLLNDLAELNRRQPAQDRRFPP